jgi:hypothetical protein
VTLKSIMLVPPMNTSMVKEKSLVQWVFNRSLSDDEIIELDAMLKAWTEKQNEPTTNT